MTTFKKSMLWSMATVLTVLYFWYLGYNIMIMDNVAVAQKSVENYKPVIVQSWE